MPSSCSVQGCISRGGFLFPKDQYVRTLWEAACGRQNWRSKKTSVVCKLHFRDEDFKNDNTKSGTIRKKLILKKEAVPSLYITTWSSVEESPPSELKELEKMAAGADANCCDLQKQLEDIEISALDISIQEEVASMKNKAESQQNQLKELENKAAGSDANCCDVQKQLEDTLEQKSSLEKRIQEEIVSMKTKEDSLQNELKEFKIKAAGDYVKYCDLQKLLEDTLNEKSALEIQIQEDIVSMKKREEFLQNELKCFSNKVAAADAKCCDLQNKLKDTLKQKSELEIKIQEEIVSMKNKVEALQSQLKELENKTAGVYVKCCNLQKQLEDTLEQKSALEIKIKSESISHVGEINFLLKEQNERILKKVSIALLVYGIGVLDKNSRVFVDSALKLPVHMHADIMALIQSVVQAGEVGLLLSNDIETVLKEPSDLRIGLSPATMLSWLQSSQTTHLLPAVENQDLCLTPSPVQSADDKEKRHCKSSKLVHLNTSLSEVTSPLRDLSIHVPPSSPLLQFVQSPLVIQKAMILQKDFEIRKLKQQLNDEIYEKDELQDVICEHQSQNVLKDSEIAQLQDRNKSLLAYQSAADELEVLKVKYEDLEYEYKLCMKYKDYVSCKENYQFLDKLTDDQHKELDKLSSEKKLLELERMKNLINSKKISQLESHIEHLQLKLKEFANCETACSREKDSLVTNLQMAKDRNELLHQELDVLQANRDNSAQGESMGVVFDLQIQEIRKELESERTGKNSLQLRLDDMLRDISERDTELASLKAVLLQKNSDIKNLKNNLKSSESQKNDLMLKIKDEQSNHHQEIEDLHLKQNEVVSRYNELIVELNSQIQDLQSNFDEILSKNLHLKNEATSSNEKLASRYEEIKNLEILNKMLMNRLNESENKTVTANDLCTDLRKQLEETKKQLDEMRKEQEDTRKQLQDTRKHSEDIKKTDIVQIEDCVFSTTKELSHHSIECSRCVYKTKTHDIPLKNSERSCKAVSGFACSNKGICQYPLDKSSFVTILAFVMQLVMSSRLGIGKGSNTVTLFNCL